MATITSPRPQSPATSIRNQSPLTSVRASLDSGPSNTPPAQRRGNRAALRDYYNLTSNTTSKPPPRPAESNLSRTGSVVSVATSDVSTTLPNSPRDSPSPSTATTTAALDEEFFNVDTYIESLLQKSSLKDILRVEATLLSEIRNLDGERKALVYDNYSKLIKATQTIGDMQRGMNDDSRGDLRALQTVKGSVERITEMTQDLSRVQPQQRTRRVRDERSKKEAVKYVLDTPRRFETLLVSGQTEELKRQWTTVSDLLGKWSGTKGVDEVKKKCLEVVAKVEDAEEGDG